MLRTKFRLATDHIATLLTVAAAVLVTGVTVSGGILLSSLSNLPTRSRVPAIVTPAPASSAPQRQRRIADFESELITIRSHGFEPQELTRQQGRFLLMVENRSGLASVSLRIRTEGGVGLRDLRLPREQPDWADLVDLPVGRYLITEADHPRWVCRVTIAAR